MGVPVLTGGQLVLCAGLVLASGVCWVTAALYDTRRIGAAVAAGAVVASWVGIGWLAWRAL